MSNIGIKHRLTKDNAYSVRVWIDKDFCACAPDLPGCCSQGKDFADCLVQITEALSGVIESYLADGLPIPWAALESKESRPLFTEERVVTVHVSDEAQS